MSGKPILVIDDDVAKNRLEAIHHDIADAENAGFAVGLATLMIAAQRSRKNPAPKKSHRLVIHERRIYAWKTDGGRTLTIKPPCGCAAFEEESPPLRGGVWTSELTCPHCGQTFMCSRTPNRYAIPGA